MASRNGILSPEAVACGRLRNPAPMNMIIRKLPLIATPGLLPIALRNLVDKLNLVGPGEAWGVIERL